MPTGKNVIWKTPDVTADGLKLFACITMLIQNIGVAIIENGLIRTDQYTTETLNEALASDSRLMLLAGVSSVMQLIGGLAVPIFAFLLVEGFRHTSDYRKYILTMALFAALSEFPYDLAIQGKWMDFSSQNALVTMALCLVMLKCLEIVRKQKAPVSGLLSFFVVLAAVLWASLLRADFGLSMVLLTAVFYLFYTRNVLKTILGVIISLLYVTGPLSFYGIWCYNEVRKDRFNKYTYYFFYPLHLLILGLAAKLFLGA